MPIANAAELLDWLAQHRFLSALQEEAVRPELLRFEGALALAKDLLARRWLTPFQVNQIFQEKGDALALGPYRLLERLGEGAMGQVYKAWNTKLERMVALKTIHKEHLESRKAMDRFRQEMETAAQLDHPNIVLVRDADEVDSRPYLVMDFVDGSDLARLVKEHGPLPAWRAADYVRQAARGLQHAVERGVVHRDIKPGNLLLSREGVVKVLDFGLARFQSDRGHSARLTHAGALLGTIDYIAPEQAEDAKSADARADIYSLGCTLYFLLTGRPPFSGDSLVEKVSARMTPDIPGVRSLRPEVSPGLEAVQKRMMARTPAERFQTPQEVVNALDPFCDVNMTLNAEDAYRIPEAPTAQTMPAGPVPVAIPVAGTLLTSPAQASDQAEAFKFGAASTGTQDVETLGPPSGESLTGTEMPASTLAARAKGGVGKPVLFGLIGLGTVLVAVAAFLLLRGNGAAAKGGYPADAMLAITLKESEIQFNLAKNQTRKKIIVQVERTKFQGPVHVTLIGLDAGISSEKVTIPASRPVMEIPITVSYTTESMVKNIRVVATALNLTSEAPLKVTVIGTKSPRFVPRDDDE